MSADAQQPHCDSGSHPLYDVRRVYTSGVVAVALNAATEALNAAFVAAYGTEDPDGPLVSAISRAQTEVKAAQKVGVDWQPRET